MWLHVFSPLVCALPAICGGAELQETENLAPEPIVLPVTEGSWYRPAPFVTWHWQLDGPVNTDYDVELYAIDLFDSSQALIQRLQARGTKVICYFSAGSYEEWRPDAEAFAVADLGKKLDGWPGERWLDIRSENVRKIVKARLDLAAEKGCDGVEPDNVDGYTNDPGFRFGPKDQLAFNRFIANEAHARNLAVGLKNNLDQAAELAPYYDFAINEQCFEYAECDALAPFTDAGKPVLNVEYQQQYLDDRIARRTLCTDSLNRQFSTLVLPLDLADGFRLSCLRP